MNLNKPLLGYEKWTLTEMDNRLELLLAQVKTLWPYPSTNFIPPTKAVDTVTLEDDENLTGRNLISYSYGNVTEHETSAWVEMFIEVISQLYSEEPSKIRMLAADKSYENIILSFAEQNSDWGKISSDVYVYKANSTAAKMRILNRLFDEYGKDKSELVFNLKPEEE